MDNNENGTVEYGNTYVDSDENKILETDTGFFIYIENLSIDMKLIMKFW